MILVFTKSACPFCDLAKSWLGKRGYMYHDIPIDTPENRDAFKSAFPELKTVPQIFYPDGNGFTNLGGYSELPGSVLDKGSS